MINVVTLVATPILIKPWKLQKLIDYVDAQLSSYGHGSAITRIGQIRGGDHVLSLFLRTEQPGDLPEKMATFMKGLGPLLGKSVEVSVHDFRNESIQHLYAGPDPSQLEHFKEMCTQAHLIDAIDEMRYPGIDDEDYQDEEELDFSPAHA